jgi:hypothetical protein
MITTKRGPGKVAGAETLVNAYKDYKELSKDKSFFDQSKEVYINVNKMFNDLLVKEYIIEQGNTFTFPHNLGSLSIKKTKIKVNNKLRVDWATSKQLDKIVYHLNSHTNGYKHFFAWSKQGHGPCKNITKYKFIPTRDHKRYLAKLLKDPSNPVDYFIA